MSEMTMRNQDTDMPVTVSTYDGLVTIVSCECGDRIALSPEDAKELADRIMKMMEE